MNLTQNSTTIVGLFDSVAQAKNAIERLVDAGVSRDQISLVAPNASNTAGTGTATHESHSVDGTTVGQNVAGGAIFGGLGGLLIGLAALAIPGVGPVLAAGPLAAALAGTGIGALGGGVIGGLKQAGVPNEDADLYAESVRRGGTIVSVTAPADRADTIASIFDDNGAVNVDERAAEYRKSGWNGFSQDAEPYTGTATTGTTASKLTSTGLPTSKTETVSSGTERTLPVVDEELQVGKREVSRGGVRVYSTTTERPVEEQVSLREERVHVDRRPVNREASEADFQNFKEGAIEVTETAEEAVVSKRARVVEEVVVGKDATERVETVRDTLRHRDVEVEDLSRTSANTGYTTGDSDTEFRRYYDTRLANLGVPYDQYLPAYKYGSTIANDPRYVGRDFESVENDLRGDYERSYPGSTWQSMKDAVRYGWDRVAGRR